MKMEPVGPESPYIQPFGRVWTNHKRGLRYRVPNRGVLPAVRDCAWRITDTSVVTEQAVINLFKQVIAHNSDFL